MTLKNMNRESRNILDDLNESVFNFYLTGSRYFGGSTETSDWDFFTADCRLTRDFLENCGFHELNSTTLSSDTEKLDDSWVLTYPSFLWCKRRIWWSDSIKCIYL